MCACFKKLTSFCHWESPLWPLKLLQMALGITCIGLMSSHCFGYAFQEYSLKTFGFLTSGSFFFISCFTLVADLGFYEEAQIPYLESCLAVIGTLLYFIFALWIPSYSYIYITNNCDGIFLALWITVGLNCFFYGMDAFFTTRLVFELMKKKPAIYYLPIVKQDRCRPPNLNI